MYSFIYLIFEKGIASKLFKAYVQHVTETQIAVKRILSICHSELIPLYTRAGFTYVDKSQVVHGELIILLRNITIKVDTKSAAWICAYRYIFLGIIKSSLMFEYVQSAPLILVLKIEFWKYRKIREAWSNVLPFNSLPYSQVNSYHILCD